MNEDQIQNLMIQYRHIIDQNILKADEFAYYVESLAAKYEVTCDYILEEFILD